MNMFGIPYACGMVKDVHFAQWNTTDGGRWCAMGQEC